LTKGIKAEVLLCVAKRVYPIFSNAVRCAGKGPNLALCRKIRDEKWVSIDGNYT